MIQYENFDDIKVDDKVIICSNWGNRVGTVSHVTPKRFKVGGTTYNKSDGKEYGNLGTFFLCCLHVTDALLEEIARTKRSAKMRKKLSNVDVAKYDYEQTKLLYDFMVEHSLIDKD